jgi:hypothetical protein
MGPETVGTKYFSFHNYVMGDNDPTTWQAKFFTDPPQGEFGYSAKAFVDEVREVIKVRDELSPATKIAIDELGTFDFPHPADPTNPDDNGQQIGPIQ